MRMRMTKNETTAITGGLTNTSKMPCASLELLRAENAELRGILMQLQLEATHFRDTGIGQCHLNSAIGIARAALAKKMWRWSSLTIAGHCDIAPDNGAASRTLANANLPKDTS